MELPFRCMSQAGVLAGAPTGQHQASAPADLPPGVTEPSAPPVPLTDAVGMLVCCGVSSNRFPSVIMQLLVSLFVNNNKT